MTKKKQPANAQNLEPKSEPNTWVQSDICMITYAPIEPDGLNRPYLRQVKAEGTFTYARLPMSDGDSGIIGLSSIYPRNDTTKIPSSCYGTQRQRIIDRLYDRGTNKFLTTDSQGANWVIYCWKAGARRISDLGNKNQGGKA